MFSANVSVSFAELLHILRSSCLIFQARRSVPLFFRNEPLPVQDPCQARINSVKKKENNRLKTTPALTPASEIHSYSTRYVENQNFFKPSVRINYGISTFKFSAIKIWLSVPPEFKRLPYMLFKKQYKRFFMGTQN